MSETTASVRLSKAAREFNIGITTVVDFLQKKGFKLDRDPNAKLTGEMYNLLMKEFAGEKHVKEEAKKIGLQLSTHETITIEHKRTAIEEQEKEQDELFIKNVALGFEKKQAEIKKKPVEEPARVKPAPAPKPDEKIPEPAPEKEKPARKAKAAEEKASKKQAAEVPAPV